MPCADYLPFGVDKTFTVRCNSSHALTKTPRRGRQREGTKMARTTLRAETIKPATTEVSVTATAEQRDIIATPTQAEAA